MGEDKVTLKKDPLQTRAEVLLKMLSQTLIDHD